MVQAAPPLKPALRPCAYTDTDTQDQPSHPWGLPKPRPEHRAWQGGILTGVTVSFFMAELYWRTDRRGSLLGKVSSGDLVAISQTPSYHSSGQSPARQGGLRRHLAQEAPRWGPG